MSEWQPIETAPKDGGTFLAHYTSPFGCRVGTMRWDIDNPKEDKREFISFAMLTETKKATHWMPLPKPPEIIHER